MNPVIKKVLAQLDQLGDSAIQKKILGVGADDSASSPMGSDATASGDDAGTGENPMEQSEPDGDELSPELLEKLKSLLVSK